ncbi:MAG: hypothetical protein M3437_16835 [Chloroflexota bacterium]|nr:hypothetical protein [Chloroflexota bacterium]MDQ5864638.1 hypothetical protein [Chloroflexota bacterium]
MFGSDWLANLFMGVFLFGLLFTAASLLLGFVGGADVGGSHGVNVDVAGHHVDLHVSPIDAHGHVDTSSGPSVLNMPTIMAALTWFGGVGYLLRNSLGLNGYVAGGLALISGLLGGTIMFVLLARVLWPMMSKPLSSADYKLPGTAARVVSPIRAGGVGEIVYVKNGSRFTAGAKSADEQAIAKGAEVVIISYEKGLAQVQEIDKLLGQSPEVEEVAARATEGR